MVAVSIDAVARTVARRSRQKARDALPCRLGCQVGRFSYLGAAPRAIDWLRHYAVLAAVRIKVKVIERIRYETFLEPYNSHSYGSPFLFSVSTGGFRSSRGGAHHHPASIADSRFVLGLYLYNISRTKSKPCLQKSNDRDQGVFPR